MSAHAATARAPSLRISGQVARDPSLTIEMLGNRLAKQSMYDGDTGDSFFSKAQHCCLVAQTVLIAGGPKAALRAMLHHVADAVGSHLSEFERALAVKQLHIAANLDFPISSEDTEIIRLAHSRVELSERRQFGIAPISRIESLLSSGVKPLTASFRPLPWPQAADRFLLDMRSYACHAGEF